MTLQNLFRTGIIAHCNNQPVHLNPNNFSDKSDTTPARITWKVRSLFAASKLSIT